MCIKIWKKWCSHPCLFNIYFVICKNPFKSMTMLVPVHPVQICQCLLWEKSIFSSYIYAWQIIDQLFIQTKLHGLFNKCLMWKACAIQLIGCICRLFLIITSDGSSNWSIYIQAKLCAQPLKLDARNSYKYDDSDTCWYSTW